jgi:hypothetical protein
MLQQSDDLVLCVFEDECKEVLERYTRKVNLNSLHQDLGALRGRLDLECPIPMKHPTYEECGMNAREMSQPVRNARVTRSESPAANWHLSF